MSESLIISILLQSSAYTGFVLAGLYFFEISSNNNKITLTKALGTLTILLNIAATVETKPAINSYLLFTGFSLLFASNILFYWSLVYVNRSRLRLYFAFDNKSSNLILKSGPFNLVRHPFYFSYSLAWIGAPLLHGHHIMYIFSLAMIYLYICAIKNEERTLLQSSEYMLYCKCTPFRIIPFIY